MVSYESRSIRCSSHARSILSVDFSEALTEIEDVLAATSILIAEIVGSGGGEAAGTRRMRRALAAMGWVKKNFIIRKIVNDVEREATSHEIDHVKAFENGTVALEIEWNNKDPFFDRDLENFKRLHSEAAISVGIIITRGALLQSELRTMVRRFATDHQIRSFDELARFGVAPTPRQRREIEERVAVGRPFSDVWVSRFVSDKFGESTTPWRKLQDRIRRGVGNPCPLLLIGLSDQVIAFD